MLLTGAIWFVLPMLPYLLARLADRLSRRA